MRRILITLAAALTMLATITTPAIAAPPDGPVHIALGDSVAAGSGANTYNTGYVPRLSRYLRSSDCSTTRSNACPHLDLSDYSAGGATSADLIASQLGPAVAEITERQADGDPANNVEYITLTIGGNDAFRPILGACSGGVDANCAATIDSVFTTYQANLAVILGTLRAVAPDAEIAIMTYYNPLAACDLAAQAPLADLVLEGGGPLPGGLNDIIHGVAAGVGGIIVVDTYGLLSATDYVGGEDCLHPDDSGHRKIARAYRGALGN
ncbi:MAG: SGNH/GDSL hydrolase family protein [Acidimicrobiia bacterium]